MQIVRPLPLTFDDYTTDVVEDDAPVWASGTTYGLGDEVLREHKVYVSTIAGNTGVDPLLENQNLTSARWLFKQYSNAFRFIDGTIGNRTVSGSTVQIDVTNVSGVEAVLIVGVKATSVHVQGFDATMANVYDRFVSLSGRDVYTFYEWFTEPIGEVQTKVSLVDVPSSVEDLTLTFAGAAIEIGELLVGTILNAGTCLLGPTQGQVKSYSRVEFNQYGELVRVKGPTRNIMDYAVHIPRIAFSTVKGQLDELAGDIVGAIGSASRQSTVQVGVLGAISWPEDLPDDYIFKFRLDGVI